MRTETEARVSKRYSEGHCMGKILLGFSVNGRVTQRKDVLVTKTETEHMVSRWSHSLPPKTLVSQTSGTQL